MCCVIQCNSPPSPPLSDTVYQPNMKKKKTVSTPKPKHFKDKHVSAISLLPQCCKSVTIISTGLSRCLVCTSSTEQVPVDSSGAGCAWAYQDPVIQGRHPGDTWGWAPGAVHRGGVTAGREYLHDITGI